MPNVLVIDDDKDYRDYLTTLLARRGYQVRSLPTGKALDEVLATERFDAVITDLYMPNVDGLEVVRKVREVAPTLPVIGITGGGAGGSVCNRAMAAFGATVVLMKPLDLTALFSALEGALCPE
jgi:DNA-binding NtrC family response regulator